MIFGIGTDIVMIARMVDLYARHKDRALDKLLAPQEISQCQQSREPARFLAKRFAAKEALGKALGTGIRAPVLLPSIAIVNDDAGKPSFKFFGPLALHMQQLGLTAHVSISDEKDTAIAFVILEKL